MHVSSRLFKTAALLLSSWENSPHTGFSQQLSLLSLPKHLLDTLDDDWWLLTAVLSFTRTRFRPMNFTHVVWQNKKE